MSETATKPAAKKSVKPSNGKPSTAISGVRLAVLKAVVALGGVGTIEKVEKRSKANHRAAYHHLWHLRVDGYVKSSRIGGTLASAHGGKPEVVTPELVFAATAKGVKAAKS